MPLLIMNDQCLCGIISVHRITLLLQANKDMDSGLHEQDLESPSALSGPILQSEFSPVLPEEVDKIVGEFGSTASMLDPCPLRLSKAFPPFEVRQATSLITFQCLVKVELFW